MTGVRGPVLTTVRGGGLPLAAIVCLAVVLRFGTLGVQGFSDDELFTVWLVRMPLGHMLSTVSETEATPHLYYFLAWLFERLLGSGETAMRVLPALLGTLTVPVVYLAGALSGSRRAGLAAAGFAAAAPFLVWYSQEARAYALMILLTAVALACLLAFLGGGSRRALGGWALASALGLASHYFAAFLFVPEAALLVYRGRGDLRRRGAALALPLLVGVALLPLAVHQRRAVGDAGGIGSRALLDRVVAIPKNLLVGYAVPAEQVVTIAGGILATVGLVLLLRVERGPALRTAALIASVIASALAVAIGLAWAGLDYISSRNLVLLLVPTAVLLGIGFASSRAGWAGLGALVAVMIVTVVGIAGDVRYQRRDWRGAAQALGPPRVDRALVFTPAFSNPGPFGVYFGPGQVVVGGGVSASEVDVVALARVGGFGPGAPAPPAGPTPPPPGGFRKTADIVTPTYRIARFTAPHPVVVSALALRRTAFPGAAYAVVTQRGDHTPVP